MGTGLADMTMMSSFAWAELYLAVAELVQRFDFDFHGLTEDHFTIESDQFIISTKGKAVLEASVTPREHSSN